MKTLLSLFLLISYPASAQEPPKPNMLPQLCFSTSMRCWDNGLLGISVHNACGLSNNPPATLHFQQSSNMVNWQTFLIRTNVPIYGCTVTNYEPYKPVCYMRVVAYP